MKISTMVVIGLLVLVLLFFIVTLLNSGGSVSGVAVNQAPNYFGGGCGR